MSEAVDNTPQEFWRPPVVRPEAAVGAMVEICSRCETEFMVGAKYCHDCGAARQPVAEGFAEHNWGRALEFLRILEFQNVKECLSLSMASLIAFFAGLGCLLAARRYSVQA
jgi:hypothetical protein